MNNIEYQKNISLSDNAANQTETEETKETGLK